MYTSGEGMASSKLVNEQGLYKLHSPWAWFPTPVETNLPLSRGTREREAVGTFDSSG